MSEHRARRKSLLWVAYDVLWLGLATALYGVSALPAFALVSTAHARGGWLGLGFSILPAYVLFVLTLVLLLAVLRAVSPQVMPGTYAKFGGSGYFALIWRAGLTSLIQTTPIAKTVNFLSVLRYAYYRGQGMRTHFENWLGTDAMIADPSLVTLGRGVSIGDLAALSCHLALPDKMLIAPIVVGDGAFIGAASKIGPGARIGARAMIGADAALGVNVVVGEDAYVEPFSRVSSNTVIGPYERWGGNPAVRTGLRRSAGEERAGENAAS